MIKIYALIDPITNQIRYIGQTKNEKYRFSKHISDAKKDTKSKKKAWIRGLIFMGFLPEMEIIDIVEDGNFWEIFYISYFKYIGFDLLNMTKGGENPPVFIGENNSMKKKESVEKLKISLREYYKKPIMEYDMNGILLRTWSYLYEILDENKEFKKKNILRCCSKKDHLRSAYNRIWSYGEPKMPIYGRQWGCINKKNRNALSA